MQEPATAFAEAWRLIATFDATLFEIVALSLTVTLTAVVIAALIGIPLGTALAVGRFSGRRLVIVIVSAAMGLPPVVVGLALYMLLSQAGPLAVLDLLYTPAAMILAQVVLITPIIAALTRTAIAELNDEHGETLRAMRASRWHILTTLTWEARPALMAATLAGMGRAFAEVGAVMIVGGNMNHATRIMTTAIVSETLDGALAMALALGMVLLALSFAVNGALLGLRQRTPDFSHA